MKIVVLTCIWKRPKITKIFLEQFKKLQEFKPKEFQLELIVVGSETGLDKALLQGFNAHYIHHRNLPLGKKWNAGVEYCKKLEFDYLLALGSDDIISQSSLPIYKRYTDEGFDYLGWKDFYLIDTIRKKMKYWEGYQNRRIGESVGAGRMFSKNLLEKLKYKPWDDNKNIGLDGSLTKKLAQISYTSVVMSAKNNQVVMADLKSDVNLGGYYKCDGRQVKMGSVVKNYFGKDILRMISRL
jgi:hypothetical protein